MRTTLHALRPEEQVLAIHGQPERRSRRLDYLNDPLFKGQFDANRFFGRERSGPGDRD